MMRGTRLMIMLMVVNGAIASVPGSEVDSEAGFEASLAKQTMNSYRLRVWATEIPSNISSSIQHLVVMNTKVSVIPQGTLIGLQLLRRVIILGNNILKSIDPFAFANLPQLSDILISGNLALESIGAFSFSNLPELTELTITNSKNLRSIHPDAFGNMMKLQYLTITNTGLSIFPDLTKISSTAFDFLFDLQDCSGITRVPANAFRGLCTQTISEIRLNRNGIKEVARGAFNGTKLKRLYLKDNQELTHINTNAFGRSSGLVVLDISQTAISSLPHNILGGLHILIAESAFHLKELPPLQLFTKLQQANLTYSSHCCAFKNVRRNRTRWNPLCSLPEARDNIYFYRDHCSNATAITCSPLPDQFTPCEDVMSTTFLRILIWIISILTLLGNGVVLLVLLGSPAKLTVPRFLMCHLAFADLCMGVYLVVIASVDTLTRGQYYNHAIEWQNGPGCNAAGFFTVFASELSVFTLTAITIERWHTIKYALRLDCKIRLRHACLIMSVGWIFSSVAALLPTVGVSSYSKVSICLPMDVEFLVAQVYIVSLLLLNILAFFTVCGCYLSIYLNIRNPSSMPAPADTSVAQRMAILIFTDFVCMAPISFFAISAALKHPLITISDSKLLLVLFYPINSCSNPFLYAFFTRTFRQDFFLFTSRFGIFKTRAQIYRTESMSCQLSGRTSVVVYSVATGLSFDGKTER
uniref:Thyrotropin receptor n=1 Tax=Solea senegalensis TaxID=28829 RepID=D7NZI8_SOLSE|nr:follicle stimulating hormone receptor [Solea senegalensis]